MYSKINFIDKFFKLYREYQESIPQHNISEIFGDYADRFDG